VCPVCNFSGISAFGQLFFIFFDAYWSFGNLYGIDSLYAIFLEAKLIKLISLEPRGELVGYVTKALLC
jgi:hypothetical protein